MSCKKWKSSALGGLLQNDSFTSLAYLSFPLTFCPHIRFSGLSIIFMHYGQLQVMEIGGDYHLTMHLFSFSVFIPVTSASKAGNGGTQNLGTKPGLLHCITIACVELRKCVLKRIVTGIFKDSPPSQKFPSDTPDFSWLQSTRIGIGSRFPYHEDLCQFMILIWSLQVVAGHQHNWVARHVSEALLYVSSLLQVFEGWTARDN